MSSFKKYKGERPSPQANPLRASIDRADGPNDDVVAADYVFKNRYVDGIYVGCWPDSFQSAINNHPVLLAKRAELDEAVKVRAA